MEILMMVLKYIIALFVLVLLIFFYYMECIRPKLPKALFKDIRDGYRDVISGKCTPLAFKVNAKNRCIAYTNEPKEMIEFKQWMDVVLEYDDFISKAFHNQSITYYQFQALWRSYSDQQTEDNTQIPSFLQNERGKRILNLLVEKGFCEPCSYKWKKEHSTYLMSLFVYAIMDELKIKRGVLKSFAMFWGNGEKTNITSLKTQAVDSKDWDNLYKTVKSVFPNFKS